MNPLVFTELAEQVNQSGPLQRFGIATVELQDVDVIRAEPM
jgi:hypothetical protein